jgi:hypothetical protein
MYASLSMARLVPVIAGAFIATMPLAQAQDADKPVTPPDSYRIVMENDRVRMIEIHVKARSKVNVDSPGNRERFLYMLSDGALILAPPGKTPYEFALHAGETAVFPAVSPTVENDTDSAVRALMVEIKTPMRTAAVGKVKGRYAKGSARTKVAARSSAGKSKPRSKAVAKARKPQAGASTSAVAPPLNLRKANARPAGKAAAKGKGSSS